MSENYDGIEGLRVLYEISSLISSDSGLEEKFIQALNKVKDAVNCQSASLFIHNAESGRLEETATVGTRVNLIETIDFDMGCGFSAWVAKQRRSVLIPSLRNEHHEGFRSFGSVPLISDEKLIGVMNLGHREPNAITEHHMQFLEIIAGQLANIIVRTRYERQLLEKNVALMKAREEIDKQHLRIVEMEKYQVLVQAAASINHEINNPLTTIIGNIDLILMTRSDLDPQIKKKLIVVLEESRRIAEIAKKLRNIKKVVTENYLEKGGEKMIDIDSSIES
jgi:signal transduction protein with GAF and PtsI domain